MNDATDHTTNPEGQAAASALAANASRTLDAMASENSGHARLGPISAQACKVRFLVTRLDSILGHHTGGMQVAPGVVLAEMRAVARLGVKRRNRETMEGAISTALAKVNGLT